MKVAEPSGNGCPAAEGKEDGGRITNFNYESG